MTTRRFYLAPVIILLVEAFLASVPAVNAFAEVATLSVPPLAWAAIDPAGALCPPYRTDCGYAYFGTTTGTVVKVSLSDFKIVAAPLTVVAGDSLEVAGESPVTSMTIDHSRGYAYFTFARWSYPDHNAHFVHDVYGERLVWPLQAQVAKVELSDFRLTGLLNLTGADRASTFSGVVDSTSSYAYFLGESATNSSPLVYEVRLFDFTLVRTLPISDRSPLGPSLIDDSNLYYGPSKISLSSFSYVGSLQLNDPSLFPGNNPPPPYGCSPCYFLSSPSVTVIDHAAGYAYFGGTIFTGGNKAMVVKVSLSDFRPVAKLILHGFGVDSAMIDTIHGYAYFGGSGGDLAQVRLSDFTTVTENEFCGSGNGNFGASLPLMDAESGYAYFYTVQPHQQQITRIDLSAPDSCNPNPNPPIWNIIQNAWNLQLPYWPFPIVQTAGLGGAASVAGVGLTKIRNKRKGKTGSSSKKTQSNP